MTFHHKIDERDDSDWLDHMAQGVLGSPVNRPDGILKVSGTATYPMDGLPDGCRHGVLVRSTIPAGRVADFELEPVKALPGICAIITDERLLRNPAQGLAGKAPVQGNGHVAYFGQSVALVVADTSSRLDTTRKSYGSGSKPRRTSLSLPRIRLLRWRHRRRSRSAAAMDIGAGTVTN